MNSEIIEGSLLKKAHELIGLSVRRGDIVVDATVGNGYDTLFLAECSGESGRVIGYDIQQEALDSTRGRLAEAGVGDDAYELYLKSHADMLDEVPLGVSAVMFNLGYLPGSDKRRITETGSTLKALRSALRCLRNRGLLAVMCYPGHPGGGDEAAAVKNMLGGVCGISCQVTIFQREGVSKHAPFLLVAEKIE